jgi:hypothetical protein
LALPENSIQNLVYNSRMAAKVDSALVQDGFQIYHHSFFFAVRRSPGSRLEVGSWTVVQQGMNQVNQTARRYHWHSKSVKDLVNEPHAGIVSNARLPRVLNLTAAESAGTRELSTELVSQSFLTLLKDIKLLEKYSTPISRAVRFKTSAGGLTLLKLEDAEFKRHPVLNEDFSNSKYVQKILWKLCDQRPENYEKLLATEGVGPKTIRALALVAEVIYGAKPSYNDPARYSFAHGGKDGTPYEIDRDTYDNTIRTLRSYVSKIK